jgi:uncharacterized repeat protein (TIGR02543 family)
LRRLGIKLKKYGYPYLKDYGDKLSGGKMKSSSLKKVKPMIISLLIAATLVFSNSSIVSAYIITDDKGPIITGYTINGTNFKVGDAVVVTVKMNDESGIPVGKTNPYMDVIKVGNETLQMSKTCVFKQISEGVYQATFYVPDTAINGVYCVKDIYVKDVYGNATLVDNPSNLNFNVSSGIADNKGPVITGYSINKTKFTVGDSLVVTVKISDDTGIDSDIGAYVKIMKVGETQPSNTCFLDMIQEGVYQAVYKIPNTAVNGDYYIYSINASDTYGDSTIKKDLSNMNFTISGGITDGKDPIVTEYSVSGHDFCVGDTVVITVKMNDDSEISAEGTYLMLLKGESPIAMVELKKVGNGIYQATYPLTDTTSEGDYNAYCIYAEDTYGNQTILDNLTNMDFSVYPDKRYKGITKLNGNTVYSGFTVVSSKTIDGDVYIGPNATAVFSDVTINGNLYVLGLASLQNIHVKNIYASNIYEDNSGTGTLSPGTIQIEGQNTFDLIDCNSYPVKDVPYYIDPKSISIQNGKISFYGSTVNVCDLYVNGVQLKVTSQGQFIADNIDLKGKDYAVLEFKTIFGNVITKNVLLPGGEYTLTYEPCNGSSQITSKVIYGGKYGTLPAVQKKDSIFEGWYTEANGGVKIGEDDIFTSYMNQTLYAHWKYIGINIISVTQDKSELGNGRHAQVTASITPANTTVDKKIIWSSSNNGIAKVDANGKITGVSAGTAIIKAQCGDKSTTVTMTINNKPLLQGDSTGDSIINVLDMELQQKNILGSNKLEDADFTAADMNHDGIINVLDMERVQKIILGIR